MSSWATFGDIDDGHDPADSFHHARVATPLDADIARRHTNAERRATTWARDRHADISWQVDAPCAGHPQVWWFPEDKKNADPRALTICAACHRRERCLEYGMSQRHGIWGGLTVRERRRLKAVR